MDVRPKLEKDRLDVRYEEIRNVYLGDERPWVVGYSGGKDSTTALQLIWLALAALPREALKKPVYILSSDTLVETPKIVEYIDESLARMNKAAKAQSLPFIAQKVKPELDRTFWVNLVGRGYPAPSRHFRWCTERLKIEPANKFILDVVAKHGEAVVVLGVRRDESATRAQVMSLHRIQGSVLSRHTTLPSAFVYTPIEDFSTNDVWTFLLQVASPWGNNNRDLVTLYRNAQAGECPLVVDKSTHSCGNSRFGCWVCTVVERDSSMEALIDNGEDWLTPFLEFRDYLSATQDPEIRDQLRQYKRRNGRVVYKDGKAVRFGPYRLSVRKELLRRLLKIQNEVGSRGTNEGGTVISKDELELIRAIWRFEEGDWEDSVPQIYREVMKRDLDWASHELPAFSGDEKASLERICNRHEVAPEMVAKLLELERSMHGMTRRSSIQQKIASIIEEDWRTDSEIQMEFQSNTKDELIQISMGASQSDS